MPPTFSFVFYYPWWTSSHIGVHSVSINSSIVNERGYNINEFPYTSRVVSLQLDPTRFHAICGIKSSLNNCLIWLLVLTKHVCFKWHMGRHGFNNKYPKKDAFKKDRTTCSIYGNQSRFNIPHKWKHKLIWPLNEHKKMPILIMNQVQMRVPNNIRKVATASLHLFGVANNLVLSVYFVS